jgi:hypothetical protein
MALRASRSRGESGGTAQPSPPAPCASRFGRRKENRRRAARPDGSVGAPGERQHDAGVAGRLGQIDVAGDNGASTRR